MPRRIKARILKLCRERYRDFSPTFASEKLEELEGVRVSRETLRKWFIEEGGSLCDEEDAAAPRVA